MFSSYRIVLALLLASTTFYEGCQDAVDREFSWFIEGYLSSRGASQVYKDWYKVFVVSEQEKSILLKTDFSAHHFEMWKPFHSSISFPDGYSINGRKRRVMRMKERDADEYSGIYIFLDIERNEIILVWGRTYGV